MRFMVLREQDCRQVLLSVSFRKRNQLRLQRTLQKQLFLQPNRHRSNKGLDSSGSIREVCFEESLKLYQGLIIEDDAIEGRDRNLTLAKAKAYCIRGEA